MSNTPTDAVASVVADAAPLTARSVVASTLLGVDPPRLPARVLVRTGELFGISDGTTRVAISRMAANGELIAEDRAYRLAGTRLTSRAARQGFSRAGARRAWNGTWRMSIVVAVDRNAQERSALRRAATRLRLAERREGVWLRPDNLPASHDAAFPEETSVLAEQCESFTARPDRTDDSLVAELFALDDWVARADLLRAAIIDLTPGLEQQALSGLGDAFVVAATALRHFQADPLLPDELLPPGWPGPGFRADYERFDAAFKAAWATRFADQR